MIRKAEDLKFVHLVFSETRVAVPSRECVKVFNTKEQAEEFAEKKNLEATSRFKLEKDYFVEPRRVHGYIGGKKCSPYTLS